MITYEVVIDNPTIQLHCHEEKPGPPAGDYELIIPPTSMTSEGGTDSRHSPFTVGTASTALIDGLDTSYGWATWIRSVKGVYPLWSSVTPTEPPDLSEIDPTWVTAIGTRFRAKAVEADAVFYPNLFGNVSKLLTIGSRGSQSPLSFAAANTWQNFDYVWGDDEYDTGGWAPNGVQSALVDITTYLYTRTVPVNPADHTLTGDYNIQVSEQCLVLYFTIP